MKPLTPRMQRAAQLLATGMRSSDVAAEVKVTPESVSIWKRIPAFQNYYLSLQFDSQRAAREALRHAGVSAVSRLVHLMTDAKDEETQRKSAADVLKLLGHGGKIQDFYLESSMSALDVGSGPDSFPSLGFTLD